MENTKIDWCDHSLNPIVWCKHWCYYCYAKRFNERYKLIPKWDDPQFFENRLKKSSKWKSWDRVFVWSMSDIFWEWISKEKIVKIFEFVNTCPDQKFMFLTKNPNRYLEFINEFPQNIMIWTTMNTRADIKKIDPFIKIKSKIEIETFASLEPLLWEFNWVDLSIFDMVIVWSMTWPKSKKAEKEWIDSIKHQNIFYKSNLI